MINAIIFISGLALGVMLGIVIMACLVVIGESEKKIAKMREKENNSNLH